MQIKSLHVCNIILRELHIGRLNRKNYIKMLKCKIDDELEIFEKLVKKKQLLLNSNFVCSLSFNKAKSDSKTNKTFSISALRLLKYKTVEEDWIEKSLAPFDAKN